MQAAKLGARCAFVGCVGDDEAGAAMRENLVGHGVDVAGVETLAGASSGVAPVNVSSLSGENAVVVVPGANALLTPAHVDAHASATISRARVLLTQCETPLDATLAALRACKEAGGFGILNAAPAPPKGSLGSEFAAVASLLVVNETELAAVSGRDVDSDADAEAAALSLVDESGWARVAVTLSARGAMLVERNSGVSRVAGVVVPPGRVIDTTGAGDSWCGALAAALAMAQAMIDAVSIARAAELACCVASRSVQSRGTQASYFGRADDADVAAMLDALGA